MSLSLFALIPASIIFLHIILEASLPKWGNPLPRSVTYIALSGGLWLMVDRMGWGETFFFWLTWLLWAHLYFHFFNMSETARRIRILLQVHYFGKTERRNTKALILPRLERLAALGAVKQKKNKYFCQSKILLAAATFLEKLERLLFPKTLEGSSPE